MFTVVVRFSLFMDEKCVAAASTTPEINKKIVSRINSNNPFLLRIIQTSLQSGENFDLDLWHLEKFYMVHK